MDVTGAAPGGLYGWILQYGQVIAFVAQIVYWALMVLFIGYAVAIYKTYTNFLMGKGKAGAAKAEQPAAKTADVDKFVD